MTFLWDNKNIFRLIEEYKRHPILWDPMAKEHKNKIKKNEAWEDISKALELPLKDVETKMHILRSQLSREKKKYYASNKAKPRWIFFDALMFLVGEPTTSSCSNTANKRENEMNGISTKKSIPRTSLISPSSLEPLLPAPSSSHKLTKRKPEYNQSELIGIVQTAKRKMDDAKDEFDIYGQYVASELRATQDMHAVLQAKSYINNILIDMRMGKYKQTVSEEPQLYGSEGTSHTTELPMKLETVEEIHLAD